MASGWLRFARHDGQSQQVIIYGGWYYVVDGARSTGRFAGASGVGTFNWQADASAVILSFSGNLHF